MYMNAGVCLSRQEWSDVNCGMHEEDNIPHYGKYMKTSKVKTIGIGEPLNSSEGLVH